MEEEVRQICVKLRSLLEEAVKDNPAEGILLSGGLDTSILAFLAAKQVKGLKAFTVSLKGFDKDLSYAMKVADFLSLEHKVYFFTEEEFLEVLPEAAGALNNNGYLGEPISPSVFIPNYIALRFAKGFVNSVYNGEGSDELFFGYPSMVKLGVIIQGDEFYTPEFKRELEREFLSLLQTYNVRFPWDLGKVLGIEVKSPYLNQRLVEYAGVIPFKYKVKEERGRVWGKWILRQAFQDYLPEEIIWREKVPIDSGTGSVRLLELLEARK